MSVLHLQSIESDLIQYQNYNRSKDPLVEGCIKQRCVRGYTRCSMRDDHSFAENEFYLIQFVMYLTDSDFFCRCRMTFYE